MVSRIYTLLFGMFKLEKSTYSIGAFLAFIIAGIEAILGLFNLKSAVITAGVLIEIVIKPVSTYLVTYSLSPLTSIFDANVA